jgi:hypothetical protein
VDFNDLSKRIDRLYISIGELSTPDYHKSIKWATGTLDISFGSTDNTADETKILNVISAMADLKDNLKKRMVIKGLNESLVDTEINNNLPLQLITDLDNQQKHGYPLTKFRRSKRDPLIQNVKSFLAMKLGQASDAGFSLDLVNQNVNMVGDTQGKTQIEADITDSSGNSICTLDEMVYDSMRLWETFIKVHSLK